MRKIAWTTSALAFGAAALFCLPAAAATFHIKDPLSLQLNRSSVVQPPKDKPKLSTSKSNSAKAKKAAKSKKAKASKPPKNPLPLPPLGPVELPVVDPGINPTTLPLPEPVEIVEQLTDPETPTVSLPNIDVPLPNLDLSPGFSETPVLPTPLPPSILLLGGALLGMGLLRRRRLRSY